MDWVMVWNVGLCLASPSQHCFIFIMIYDMYNVVIELSQC